MRVPLSGGSGIVEVPDQSIGTFVFRPGGTAGGNVFTTWAGLMAAASTVQGPKIVQVDTSIAAAHMTAGAWNVDGFEIRGMYAGTVLTIDVGVTLTWNTLWFRAIHVQSNATAVVSTSNGAVAPMLALHDGADLQCLAGGPFFELTAGLAQIFCYAAQIGDDVHAVFESAAGAEIVLNALADTTIETHALSGAGTAFVIVDASSLLQPPQDVTTLTPYLPSSAPNITYAPASNANWNNNPPATIAAALDRIAAKIGPIT